MVPTTMAMPEKVFNLMTLKNDGTTSYVTMPLFFIMVIIAALCGTTIFLYKNRRQQILLCRIVLGFIAAWYIAYGIYGTMILPDNSTIRISLAMCFPFCSAVFVVLAIKGIKHDEQLIKSADRIR